MTPQETGRDLFMRGASLVADGIEAMIRQAIAIAVPRVDEDERVKASLIARERGYTTAAVSRWCKEHPELKAQRAGERGNWYVSRRAIAEFLSNSNGLRLPRRGTRRRLVAVA